MPMSRRLKPIKNNEAAFYDRLFQSARYCINVFLPGTMGKTKTIKAVDGTTFEIPEAAFDG